MENRPGPVGDELPENKHTSCLNVIGFAETGNFQRKTCRRTGKKVDAGAPVEEKNRERICQFKGVTRGEIP